MSASAMITLPRADSDLLMLEASLSRSPDALVAFCLSLPARSTRFRHECRCFVSPSAVRCVLSTLSVKSECERDDSLFIDVSPTCRFRSPRCSNELHASASLTSCQVDLARVQQVCHRLVVDLQVGAADDELEASGTRGVRDVFLESDLVKEVVERPGNEPSLLLRTLRPVKLWTLHGESLSAACLAVGEDTSVVPLEDGVCEWLPDHVEHFLLRCARISGIVKGERLRLVAMQDKCVSSGDSDNGLRVLRRFLVVERTHPHEDLDVATRVLRIVRILCTALLPMLVQAGGLCHLADVLDGYGLGGSACGDGVKLSSSSPWSLSGWNRRHGDTTGELHDGYLSMSAQRIV
eukprot:750431-Hanusia_phi.AAC.1